MALQIGKELLLVVVVQVWEVWVCQAVLLVTAWQGVYMGHQELLGAQWQHCSVMLVVVQE
jgi:hypothetical protein